MSIEKESSGLPEFNVQRRTTKVNLSVIVAVILFFAIAVAVAFWIYREPGSVVPPSPTTQNEVR
ncbi:MAG: hypothetical protein ABIZ49_09705 [Opitutaceae bacterium]